MKTLRCAELLPSWRHHVEWKQLKRDTHHAKYQTKQTVGTQTYIMQFRIEQVVFKSP